MLITDKHRDLRNEIDEMKEKRLILCGDPMQLSPISCADARLFGRHVSVFERLITQHEYKQFKTCRSILESMFISKSKIDKRENEKQIGKRMKKLKNKNNTKNKKKNENKNTNKNKNKNNNNKNKDNENKIALACKKQNHEMAPFYSKLNIQHRMHPSIAKFPNDEFYGGKLQSKPQWNKIECINWKRDEIPILFIDYRSKDVTDAARTYIIHEKDNEFECHIVKQLLQLMQRKKDFSNVSSNDKNSKYLKQCDIGIIAPFRNQVSLLKDKIGKYNREVDINTIDGYQGKEKRLIVLSMTICTRSRSKQCNYVNERQRCNVALTRARDGLVVIGDGDALGQNRLWREWTRQHEQVTVKYTDYFNF